MNIRCIVLALAAFAATAATITNSGSHARETASGVLQLTDCTTTLDGGISQSACVDCGEPIPGCDDSMSSIVGEQIVTTTCGNSVVWSHQPFAVSATCREDCSSRAGTDGILEVAVKPVIPPPSVDIRIEIEIHVDAAPGAGSPGVGSGPTVQVRRVERCPGGETDTPCGSGSAQLGLLQGTEGKLVFQVTEPAEAVGTVSVDFENSNGVPECMPFFQAQFVFEAPGLDCDETFNYDGEGNDLFGCTLEPGSVYSLRASILEYLARATAAVTCAGSGSEFDDCHHEFRMLVTLDITASGG